MEIKIEVDESKFAEILNRELEDFPKEELQKIVGEAMKNYFTKDGVKDLMIKDTSGYNYSHKEPTDFLKSLIQERRNEFIDPMINRFQECLKDDKQVKDIMKGALVDLIFNNVSSRFFSSDNFNYSVREIVDRMICNNNN